MRRKRKRLWAPLLSAVLIVAQLPAVAMAENYVPEDGSIASFELLDSGVKKQIVPVGTELSGLNLPDTVTAAVYHVTGDMMIPNEGGIDDTEDESGDSSTATPSDAGNSASENSGGDFSHMDNGETVATVTTSTEEIPVAWNSEPAYDGDKEGSYVFTAVVGGYGLSSGAKLPRITVKVEVQAAEPAPVRTVTGWTFADDGNLNGGELALPGVSMDNQADFDTVVSMLPTQIHAEIEGEPDTVTLDIAVWSSPGYKQDGDGNWPLTGDFLFTAEMPEGYACVQPPVVKVTLGGAGVLTINDRHYVNDLVYQETGPKTVQLIGPIDIAYMETVRVPAEITSRGRTYSVTDIGNRAFEGIGITGLDLRGADNLTRIGQNAFNQCGSLTGTVSIPAGVTYIDRYAFGNSGITGLDLSGADGLTRIGQNAFNQCSGLTGTVSIPAGVTDIDEYAFSLSGITGLDLSGADGLTRIGDSAFSQCDDLKGIISIPAAVSEIGDWAFSLSGITGLDFNGANSLIRIGNRAFNQCAGLTGTISIPAAVSEIEDWAFYLSGITGLDLNGANGLTRIGTNTFYQCIALTGTVSVPGTVMEIGMDAFLDSNITNFTAANDEVAELLRDCGVAAGIIKLPSGASPSIPPVDKFSLSGLKYRVTGSDTVSVIGIVYGSSGNLDIPDQVMHNGNSYRVTEIGRYAFDNDPSITRLNLGGAHFLKRIGSGAFMNCIHLTGTLKIPASVTEIEDWAFYLSGITGLDLSGAEGLTQIGTEAFYKCGSLTGTLKIPASVIKIQESAFFGAGITGLDLSGAAGLMQIGAEVFYTCKNLTGTVAIPSNVTEIGDLAFQGAGLTGLDLSGADSLTDIGRNAFQSCESLTGKVDIPATVTQIQESAFEFTGITEAAIRGRLQSIGNRVFPLNIPIHCSDPYTQLLVNKALMHKDIPTASWDGQGDVPPGAIVTVDRDITVNGTVAIGEEAEISIGDGTAVIIGAGGTVTVEPGAVITIKSGGTLTIDPGASLNGGGTIVVEPGGVLNGTPGSGILVVYRETVVSGSGGNSYTDPMPQNSYTMAGSSISQSVSRSDLQKLAYSGKSLTLRCENASMTFEPAALNTILAAVPASAGSIAFAAAPASLEAFPDAAKLIGNHPVYDFTISCKDGNGEMITVSVDFPAGSAAITLNYTPADAEVTGSLFMVYVDSGGAVPWLDKSSYQVISAGGDREGALGSDHGKVLAEVSHFSTYGVACKSPAPVFTDVAGHWAKEDIEFAAARGLLSGTGNSQFSPDGTMTRGMFVTALGRLAGVNPDSYKTCSFTDVKVDASYAPYAEWAVQKNIAAGTGDKLFSPDAPVTREQMAVMLVNCAGQMGCSIPTPLASVTFADNDKISAWAAMEVAAMQRAGIVKGKDGNRYDPQASATRAEGAAVLRRFVETMIDPDTAMDWVKNDSGHWLYYKGGKALTGWQTIGKLRYFFNADGVMHEGWKQDTDTNKWYYWTNAGAATGWREIDGKWYCFDENGVMS